MVKKKVNKLIITLNEINELTTDMFSYLYTYKDIDKLEIKVTSTDKTYNFKLPKGIYNTDVSINSFIENEILNTDFTEDFNLDKIHNLVGYDTQSITDITLKCKSFNNYRDNIAYMFAYLNKSLYHTSTIKTIPYFNNRNLKIIHMDIQDNKLSLVVYFPYLYQQYVRKSSSTMKKIPIRLKLNDIAKVLNVDSSNLKIIQDIRRLLGFNQICKFTYYIDYNANTLKLRTMYWLYTHYTSLRPTNVSNSRDHLILQVIPETILKELTGISKCKTRVFSQCVGNSNYPIKITTPEGIKEHASNIYSILTVENAASAYRDFAVLLTSETSVSDSIIVQNTLTDKLYHILSNRNSTGIDYMVIDDNYIQNYIKGKQLNSNMASRTNLPSDIFPMFSNLFTDNIPYKLKRYNTEIATH